MYLVLTTTLQSASKHVNVRPNTMVHRVRILDTVGTDGRTGKRLNRNWKILLVALYRAIVTVAVTYVTLKRDTARIAVIRRVDRIVMYAGKDITAVRILDVRRAHVQKQIAILRADVMSIRGK